MRPLEADLTDKVAGDGEVRSRLEAEWRQAFDAGRTGAAFEAWRDDRLTQVAVAWLLACVFVRFCEDNHLVDEAAIAGSRDRGDAARAAQQRWFAAHPHDSDREYLHSVFRAAAVLPGLGGLLAEGESPLWLVDPPADACTRLLTLFRATDAAGDLVHDFTDAGWSTRFLGDLYQDLSEHAKSTYALLQTPEFVEEFILDRTSVRPSRRSAWLPPGSSTPRVAPATFSSGPSTGCGGRGARPSPAPLSGCWPRRHSTFQVSSVFSGNRSTASTSAGVEIDTTVSRVGVGLLHPSLHPFGRNWASGADIKRLR